MPELTDMTGEGKPRPSGGGHGLTQPNSAARRPAGRLDAYSSIATTFFDIGGEDELEEAFLNAAREGDYDKIEGILKRRNESLVNIDARDGETGNTALIWAAKRGHVTIVQLLLRSGADITLRNFEGHTAVEVASPQIRQILLDSVDKGGPHRNLLQAAWQGNAKLVKKILTETKHVDINCRNADGLTPLLLVTRDVQLFERVGNRIMRGYEATEVVNELLKYRADPNVVDEEGRTPLHHAASSKANTAGRMVKQLLNQGCEIEVRDRRHFTAIHCACQSGNVEVVVALLEGGSDANLRGYAGSTPLHISALNGHDQVATKLLERGADVTMVDDSGLTPVDVAKTKKVKVALKQAWTEATQGKIEKNLRPVRLSSGEGVRKSREGLPKQRKGGQVIFDSLATSSNLSMSSSFEAITPRKAAMSVLQRQLINSERARQAEEQMKREVIEARYSRHNRHYSTNNSSPTSRLAPLKSHTPRRKDVKFAPDTKTHDGHHHGMGQRAPSTGKHIPLHKTSSDPTKLSSQGCHFVPVTVLGLELDENLQDIKMRHLAQGASSLSKKRNLSDSAANSPIYMDQLGDELCLRGRSPSKASLATMSEDWETTSFSTTVSALSSSPPYNNHINPRTPSAGSEHSRLRVPDAITEENYNHYHVLDLDRMQLTNQTRTPVQSDGVYPTSRTLLPPTPISQQDDYLSVTDMRVTDMSQDFSGASSKESSPRSSYDSDEEDHVNEQIRLAVPDLTQLTRSKSILRQGNFNIESTRVTPKPPKEENNLRKSDDSGCPEDKDSGSNRSSVGSNGSSTGSSSSGTASSSCPQNNMDVKKFKSKKELDIKRNVSPNSAEVASAKLKAASRDNAVKVKQATSSAVTPVGCPGPIQRLTPGVENQHNSELSYTSKLIHVQECPSDNVSNNISGKCNDTNGLNSSAQKNKVTIHSTALNDVLKNEDDEIVNEKPDSGGKSGRKAPPRPTEKPQIQHSNNNNVRTHSVTMAAPTQPASTPPGSGKEHNSVEKNQSQMANKRPPITPRSTSGNKVSDSNSHISRNPTPRTAIQHNKSDSSNPSSSPAQSRRPSLSPGRSGQASPGQKSRQKSPGRTGQVSPNRTRDKSPASPRQNRQQPPSSRPTSQSQKNRPVVPPRPATWNNNFKKLPVQKCTSGKADSTFKASVSTAQNTKTVLPKQNAKTPPARPPAPQASKNSTNSNVKNNDTENKGTVGGDVTLPKGKLQRSGSNSEFSNEKPQSGYSGIASKQPKMPSLAAGENGDNGVIGTPPRVVKPEDIVSNKNSEANIKSPDSKGKETNGSNKKDKTGGKLSVDVSEQKVMSGEKTAISENSPSVRKIVEHKGPVICDPFEAIRAQLRQQENQVQQENAKANRLRSAKPRAGVNSATRKGSKDVRQGSAGKKKKAEKKPPADAVRIVRPKSGKKGKGKKKKKSAEKTRLGISDQDDLTNVAFIGGLGWHIQTDCDMNQVKPVKFRPPVADWSDEESEIISARVKPNYVHSPRSNDGDEAEERSKSAKTREKLVKKADQTGGVLLQLPGAISEGESAAEDTEEEVEDEEVEEEEEEIEGTEDVEEEVVFDHTLKESGSKSGTPRGARLTVTPGKTITISPRSGGRSPRRSPRSIHRGASRGAISPNSPLRSPKGHGVSGRERSPRVSGKNLEVLLTAETKAVDKSTTNKVETPATSETVVKTVSKEKLNDEVGRVEDAVCDGSESESSLNENKESVGTHNKDSKNSYNDKGVSSVTGEQQSEEHLVDQSTEKEANAKAQKSKCVKSFSHTKAPISKKKEDEELEDAINEILQTTPNPSLTLSLKSQSSVHSKSEVKERSSRSPEEARSQFEQQLQKSLDGKSFREVPVQETEDLDLDKLHEDFDIGEDEKMELERLMDSLKKMDLMVSLPLDVDSGEEESTPRDENETTPRQDDTASKKPQHRKPVNKPPIPPKSSTSPKQTDKPAKSPSGGGKAPRVEKLHMPGTSFVAEKSPRFVRKQDSWKENKQARPVLPPEENDGRIGLHRRDSDQMSEASNNSEAISLPSTMGDQDSMVPSDSRVVTSRLGRRSANSRAASAMTTDSSFDDTIDTIQWKRGNMLGQGAYGKVWCGLTNCGELIAVKQIELNMADMDKAEVEYEKIQEEVELLKTLKHRNIVGYLGTSLEDNIVSIFMQFVPGGSLASVLARFGALEEEVFCYYTKQILEGVAYLHANNVIHRDIKGGNIMLMQNGVIKLIDFGCAKRLCLNVGSTGSTSTSQNRLLKSMRGTPYWMAPEVVREIGYGTKSDIWSIGCTMFEMATRKPPWADMSPMAAIFAIGSDRPIPRLPEKFSEPACDFVDKCLTRDQNIRPSASELLSHLFIARKRKRGSRVEAGH